MGTVKTLVGQKLGRWVVVGDAGSRGERRLWLCRCECGTERRVLGGALTSGSSRSCGCLQRERAAAANTTHGMIDSAVYKVWEGMKGRCLNSRASEYHNYGGRGISVCDQWLSFELFLQDMGHPPAGFTLERIDNNAGYSKANCRWATRAEQARNQRRNRFLTYEGVTFCLTDWAARQGLSPKTLLRRLGLGWPLAKALSQPIELHRKRGEVV